MKASVMNINNLPEIDPSIFDQQIKEQKAKAKENRDDAHTWLKLGCLQEDRLEVMRFISNRNFFIRHIMPLSIAMIGSVLAFLTSEGVTITVYTEALGALQLTLFALLLVSALIWMAYNRYPESGYRSFKKAIQINPALGEAYIHLGRIYLRRLQKRKACRMFERAFRLDESCLKVENQLKSIYEKEFIRFFNRIKEQETKKDKEILLQQREIEKLKSEINALDSQNRSTTGKANRVIAMANRKIKLVSQDLVNQTEKFRQEYEEKISSLERETSEMGNEQKQQFLSRLTSEIIEAKAKGARQSFRAAETALITAVGPEQWRLFSKQCRCYLATAEQTYIHLVEESSGNRDLSLIGMELCKALEFEINRVFVAPFRAYLGEGVDEFLKIEHTGTRKNQPTYFTFLSKVIDQENYPEVTTLTLGQFLFVLRQTLNNEYSLQSYKRFLFELRPEIGCDLDRKFIAKLNTVTNGYRNSIVHNSPMSREQCDHLRDLIFASNDALLRRVVGVKS